MLIGDQMSRNVLPLIKPAESRPLTTQHIFVVVGGQNLSPDLQTDLCLFAYNEGHKHQAGGKRKLRRNRNKTRKFTKTNCRKRKSTRKYRRKRC